MPLALWKFFVPQVILRRRRVTMTTICVACIRAEPAERQHPLIIAPAGAARGVCVAPAGAVMLGDSLPPVPRDLSVALHRRLSLLHASGVKSHFFAIGFTVEATQVDNVAQVSRLAIF